MNLHTGRVSRLEALARLRQRGRLLPPAEFLPSYGPYELWKLFEVAVRNALTARAQWARIGLQAGVSVNLPASGMLTPDRVSAIRSMVPAAPGRSEVLTVELLETGSPEVNDVAGRSALRELGRSGIRIAQDDLGTGYSTLARMGRLTFDDVKVARELVKGIPDDVSRARIIGPLASLAHQRGAELTVEGLESRGMVEASAIMGADNGQGYAIARPMPPERVVPWSKEFRLPDPYRPKSAVGLLAAHLAWELQLEASQDEKVRQVALRAPCLLGGYLESGSASGRARQLHVRLHNGTSSPFSVRDRLCVELAAELDSCEHPHFE